MRFADIKINNYVKFNEALKYLYFKVAEDFLWVDESLECILEVRDVDLDKRMVSMECVDGCGTHAKLDFTEEEYNDMCRQLGEDVLKISTLSEALNPTKVRAEPESYELTVKDNLLIVNKFLDILA